MRQPKVSPMENGRDWLLLENYTYALNDGRTLFIPDGFIFDSASIPRIAWRLFPPSTGKHRTPALIHDWLCASGNVSWSDAADIFLQAMKVARVNCIKRYAIYWAVRSFGPFHKQDPRQDRLRLLQRVAIEQCREHYSYTI